MREECRGYFRELCQRRGVSTLSKAQWREMTSGYLGRLMCNTGWRRERIFRALSGLYPEAQAVTEEVFVEMTRAMLKLANDDLCERLRNLKDKLQASQQPPQGPQPPSPSPSALRSFEAASPPQLQRPEAEEESLRALMRQEENLSALLRQQALQAEQQAQECAARCRGLVEIRRSAPSPVPPVNMNLSRPAAQPQHAFAHTLEHTFGARPQTCGDVGCAGVVAAGGFAEGERFGLDPSKDATGLRVPTLGGSSRSVPPVKPQELDLMKYHILNGALRVTVFNKSLEQEPKRLALNTGSGRLSLLRDDGLCDASWEISCLRCIVQGIAASIMADAPPPDRAAAFRFRLAEDAEGAEGAEDQDLFLCVVFETAEAASLATQAFCELCHVPVVRGQ